MEKHAQYDHYSSSCPQGVERHTCPMDVGDFLCYVPSFVAIGERCSREQQDYFDPKHQVCVHKVTQRDDCGLIGDTHMYMTGDNCWATMTCPKGVQFKDVEKK
jgi:hypothetical protein